MTHLTSEKFPEGVELLRGWRKAVPGGFVLMVFHWGPLEGLWEELFMEGAAHSWPLGMAGRGHSSSHGLGELPNRTLLAQARDLSLLGVLPLPSTVRAYFTTTQKGELFKEFIPIITKFGSAIGNNLIISSINLCPLTGKTLQGRLDSMGLWEVLQKAP